MIEATSGGLRIGHAVVRALLTFAAENAGVEGKFPGYCGIGIETEGVCATDGHTGVRFLVPQEEQQLWLGAYDRRYFPRKLVEERLEETKGKQPCIELGWHELLGVEFPALSEAEPERVAVSDGGGVMLDPLYLERIVAVARACRRPREPGEAQLPSMPGALLVGFKDELQPVRFEIGTQDERCAHVAYVTIMPMRQVRPSGAAVAKAVAATSGAKERKRAKKASRSGKA